MSKEFSKTKDGKLLLTITEEKKLTLPGDKVVGVNKNVVYNYVDKDKVDVFKGFIHEQINQMDKQIVEANQQLNQLQDINVDLIDPKLSERIEKASGKGSKSFKESVKVLNNYIQRINQKSKALATLKMYEEQLKEANNDLKQIETLLK